MKQKVAVVSQVNSKISIAEISSKKCYFLPLKKQNTATTNEGNAFLDHLQSLVPFLHCFYVIIVRLQHIVFQKLNLQRRHKTSSIIAT